MCVCVCKEPFANRLQTCSLLLVKNLYVFTPGYLTVCFLRTGTNHNWNTSMKSGNLTLIYYYVIHYPSVNFANSLDMEFYS